eukprot:6458885-Amphidinium_carterae.1
MPQARGSSVAFNFGTEKHSRESEGSCGGNAALATWPDAESIGPATCWHRSSPGVCQEWWLLPTRAA